MHSLQFGAITRAILKNPPVHPGWPNPGDPDYARRYEEVSRTYERDYSNAINRFREKINEHLAQLEQTHQGERDYFASAEPFNFPSQSLILDGEDYKHYAVDVRLEVQRWLNAFEQIVNRKKANNEPFYRAEEDDMKNTPLRRVYNWHNAMATGYMLESVMKRAEFEVTMRYWQRAQNTLEIVV